jgi:hypothetical protein
MKAYKHIPTSTHQSKIVGALPTEIPKGVKGDFDPHRIVRQASLAGYPMPNLKATPLKPYKNVLYNKSEIKRPAFLNVKILPRQLPDFDQLQVDNIERFGLKVQIDPKSLENYFNKPKSGADQNLNKIEEAVKDGLQENKENQVILIGELTKILAKTEGSSDLIEANRKLIQNIMNKLDIPVSREAYNLPKYVDYSNYIKQQGLINLYLMKKADDKNLDLLRPVVGITEYKNIELNSVRASLKNGNILDLDKSTLNKPNIIKREFNDLQPSEYAFDGKTLDFMRKNNNK